MYPRPVRVSDRNGSRLVSPHLDVPHTADRTGYLPGLSCKAHNRRDGAQRSGTKGIASARPGNVTCPACGKTYHYAARSCEICRAHYHPNRGDQRTCGRACGVILARRNREARGWIPKSQRPKPAPKPRRAGPVASGQREPANGWPSIAIETYACKYCGKLGVRRVNPRSLRVACDARVCQLRRQMANSYRVRYGMTAEEADAAVLTRSAPSAIAVRRCGRCGQPSTTQFRWCADCQCASTNAKGRQCRNPAGADGLCDYHADATHSDIHSITTSTGSADAIAS